MLLQNKYLTLEETLGQAVCVGNDCKCIAHRDTLVIGSAMTEADCTSPMDSNAKRNASSLVCGWHNNNKSCKN